MPKQTFLNLSSERQKEIINISLKEFSSHNFETASMNKIITELGIAKGSFYRYFKNKNDLYLFLLDYAVDKKIDYLERHIDTESNNFFEIYRSVVFNYMKFDLTFPIMSKFLRSAVENRDIEQTKILNSLNGKTFIENVVIHGQEQGQIKKTLSVDFIILCIINLSESIINYIKLKLGIDYKDLLNMLDGKAIHYKNQLEDIFNQLISVLETGLKPVEIH
ncbi:AcrR family transcriptional regulator [Clostridium novyi A str. BKT29909]|uniref:TetR/AcrR family transcriptional regulator n=1 Tax=Clostridium TaxID=1485 RepID=UPI0004D5DD17|nr:MULTISPECIES: TetR/AcrR family transcriptional regulator [Clostridium]KEH89481.1 AcrR family transcriptional regulator [Clostridium novyi A str. BKT29909]KEH93093.1 AcrR family transcriptional regulator [Clostridium botulinum C/D str. It1]